MLLSFSGTSKVNNVPHCISEDPSALKEWINIMGDMLRKEKNIYQHRGCAQKLWGPWCPGRFSRRQITGHGYLSRLYAGLLVLLCGHWQFIPEHGGRRDQIVKECLDRYADYANV